MPRNVMDYTGYKYSYLTVLEPSANRTRDGRRLWVVQCECGAKRLMLPKKILEYERAGRPASCGCKKNELIAQAKTHHGMSHHPAFAVWRSMIARCTNPKHRAWRNYGGRGITVCDRWLNSFEAFWADMGPTYQEGLDLDRKDNEQGYFAENCRWVTRTVNCRNKRSARRVDLDGKVWDLKELAETSGVGYTTLLYRLDHNCALEHLLDKPDPRNRFST